MEAPRSKVDEVRAQKKRRCDLADASKQALDAAEAARNKAKVTGAAEDVSAAERAEPLASAAQAAHEASLGASGADAVVAARSLTAADAIMGSPLGAQARLARAGRHGECCREA